MLYDSSNDVHLRLDSSIIRLDDQPVYVFSVESNSFNTVHLTTKEEERVRFNDERINIEPVPLGYINTERYGTTYLVRIPCRRYKQGLHRNNIRVSGNEIPVFDCFTELGMTILNDFWSLEAALTHARTFNTLSAFDRKFAVQPNGKKFDLLYKTDVIGTINDRDYQLLPKYAFLEKFIGGELDEYL